MTLSIADYQAAAIFPTATLLEASGGHGALPSAIKPIVASMRLCGRALTIQCGAGDNLWIHKALLQAQPGDVLVCSVGGGYEHGYWGEILTVAAIAKGVAGLVIDGCVRDADPIERLAFPVFSRGLCIRGTSKRPDGPGSAGEPVLFGEVTVSTGDLVVGDRDGVFTLPAAAISEVVSKSYAREGKERRIMDQLRVGQSTMSVYGW